MPFFHWDDPDGQPPSPGQFLRLVALWLLIFVVFIGGARSYEAWHESVYPGQPNWLDETMFYGRRHAARAAAEQSSTVPDMPNAVDAQFSQPGAAPEEMEMTAHMLREMGDVAGALMFEAYISSAKGDAERAMALADEAIALDPGDPDFWSAHAEMALALSRFDTALASYRRAYALAPERFDFRRRAALVLAERGDATAARAELDAVLAGSPHFVAARVRRAALRLSEGDVAGARADLDRAIADGLGPEDGDISVKGSGKMAEVHTCRGLLRSLTDPDIDVLDDFHAAQRSDPHYGEARLARFLTERRLNVANSQIPTAWEGDDHGEIGVGLIQVYRGSNAPATVLARIPAEAYFGRRSDLAIAQYYLAEWWSLQGDSNAARHHFQAALTEGVPYVCEFGLARLRLAELGG